MKTILILISTLLINSCGASKDMKNASNMAGINSFKSLKQTTQNITKIEYVSSTRGFYNRITVTPKLITKQLVREGKEIHTEITPLQWTSLLQKLDHVDVPSLPNLKAPSSNHRTDVVPAAWLHVTVNEKAYTTQTFDTGNPPKELSEIVENLIELNKTKVSENSKVEVLEKKANKEASVSNNIKMLEYKANSRGTHILIRVNPKNISYRLNRNNELLAIPTTKENWEELMTLMANIEVKSIPDLEAPSKTHQYDGAPHANFKVYPNKKDQAITTPTFDHGKPNKAIAEIVEKMLTLIPSKK